MPLVRAIASVLKAIFGSRRKRPAAPKAKSRPSAVVPRVRWGSSAPSSATAFKPLKAQTNDAVMALLQPFVAFNNGILAPMPDSQVIRDTVCFWTRTVRTFGDVTWSGSSTAGTRVTISPSPKNMFRQALSLSTTGVPTSNEFHDDAAYTYIETNFDSVAVAYQGIRIRNLTSVSTQNGEVTVVRSCYSDADTAAYAGVRSAANSFTASAADPGSGLEQSYRGVPSLVANVIDTRVDYAFCDVDSIPEANSNVITLATNAITTAQNWEVEVVTCYHGVPFMATGISLPTTRYICDIIDLASRVDHAYTKHPMNGVDRCVFTADARVRSDDERVAYSGGRAPNKPQRAGGHSGRSLRDKYLSDPLTLVRYVARNTEPAQYPKIASLITTTPQAAAVAYAPAPMPFSAAQLSFLRGFAEESKQEAEYVRDTPAATPIFNFRR